MRTFFPATIRGRQGAGDLIPDEQSAKDLICCADDIVREYTWSEINGVRRITEILFSSEKANTELGFDIQIQRTFTYQASSPYDLTRITDVVVLV